MSNLYKIEDNENCPCGSNITYKKCCENRKDENREIDKYIKNEKQLNAEALQVIKSSKFSACLHPTKDECSKDIINAHTLQNNGVLSYLALNNEVIVLEPGINKEGVKFDYKSKSKNQATTFRGFCSFHDKEVFKPIEDEIYDKNREDQNFLFTYRIFAFEYYKKKVAMKVFQKTARKYPSSLKHETGVRFYRNYQLAMEDMNSYSKIFNSSLLSKNYSTIETKVFEFDYRLPFATCFAFSPYFDFNEKPLNVDFMLQHNSDRLKLNFVTVLPQNKKSYVLYSWLSEDSNYFSSLNKSFETFTELDIKKIFNNLIPEYSEHIVFAPEYWNNLSETQKNDFNTRMGNDFPQYNDDIMMIPDYVTNKSVLSNRPMYNLFKDYMGKIKNVF